MYNKQLSLCKSPMSLLLIGQPELPLLADAKEYVSQILHVPVEKVDSHPDFFYISPESSSTSMGVEEAQLANRASYIKPSIAEYSVVLIDHFEQMTIQGQNKLLKQLEDCTHVLFILTAYNDTILSTIKSRLVVFQYHPMSKEDFALLIGCDELDFWVTGGCPEALNREDYLEIKDIFAKAGDAVQKEAYMQLFVTLHLVKEKDQKNFFTQYPDFVKNLYDYIGNLILSKETASSVDMIRIKTLTKHLAACTEHFYTKEHFFQCIAELKGGCSYELI